MDSLLGRLGIGLVAALALLAPARDAAALPAQLLISEVFFDANGRPDDGRQWVELYNNSGSDIVLGGAYSLGLGRDDYTRTTIDLTGTILAGDTFVVGGTISDGFNYNPSFNQPIDFGPNMRRGYNNNFPDGIGLFAMSASAITQGSPAIHTLIYGESTATPQPWLTDETGALNSGVIGFVLPPGGVAGQSLALQSDGSWLIEASPAPGAAPAPEPRTALLLVLGLIGLRLVGRRPLHSR